MGKGPKYTFLCSRCERDTADDDLSHATTLRLPPITGETHRGVKLRRFFYCSLCSTSLGQVAL